MCKKELAKKIFMEALSSVMPKNLIADAVSYHDNILCVQGQSFDLAAYDNVYVYGSGKASIEMAKAMKILLKDKITHNMVVSNYHESVQGVEVLESTHPLPSQKSLDAGERLLHAFAMMGEHDFFIYLLSGGSSALIEKPVDGVSLEDFSALTKVLLHNGLSIDEINVIRKYLSQIKGGGLASKTKAKGMVLVVSDVIGDDLHSIGSAPLLADKNRQTEVRAIVDKYNILHLLPKSVKYILENDDTTFDKEAKEYPHFLIASNRIALNRAEIEAKALGLSVTIVSDKLEGDVKELASYIVETVQNAQHEVLLFGGEPTVEVKGDGNGGRNQELSLWVLKKMQGCEAFTFLSAGSDGIDGNSDAAGAVVCQDDYHDSVEAYLAKNDSYHYLKAKETLIMTGESGTNVMDIMIVVK
jgi:hydroxypyruvate reductase/glycerate 2-kinase